MQRRCSIDFGAIPDKITGSKTAGDVATAVGAFGPMIFSTIKAARGP
jgi:hypothetical protein